MVEPPGWICYRSRHDPIREATAWLSRQAESFAEAGKKNHEASKNLRRAARLNLLPKPARTSSFSRAARLNLLPKPARTREIVSEEAARLNLLPKPARILFPILSESASWTFYNPASLWNVHMVEPPGWICYRSRHDPIREATAWLSRQAESFAEAGKKNHEASKNLRRAARLNLLPKPARTSSFSRAARLNLFPKPARTREIVSEEAARLNLLPKPARILFPILTKSASWTFYNPASLWILHRVEPPGWIFYRSRHDPIREATAWLSRQAESFAEAGKKSHEAFLGLEEPPGCIFCRSRHEL